MFFTFIMLLRLILLLFLSKRARFPECLQFSNTIDHVVVLVYTVNNVIKLTFVANVGIFVTHNGAQNAHGISDRLH